LTVGQRPLSYSSFRYIGIGELRKNEPIKKIRRKITIPDEVTQIEYKAYLSDFEIENFNPHLNEYKRLYRKVNPKNLIRYPISEVYQFFEEEITCVYKNTNIRKNSLEKDYRFLRNICSEKSRGLIPRLHFTPFGFIGVPEILTGNEQEIMVLTGGKFGGKLGGGGADFYERSEDRFTLKKSVIYWMS
jgi:hypothetical protein